MTEDVHFSYIHRLNEPMKQCCHLLFTQFFRFTVHFYTYSYFQQKHELAQILNRPGIHNLMIIKYRNIFMSLIGTGDVEPILNR